MRYLIDTDWIIEYLKGNDKITGFLVEKFEEGLAISIISLAELYDGVFSSRDPKRHEQALRDFVSWGGRFRYNRGGLQAVRETPVGNEEKGRIDR